MGRAAPAPLLGSSCKRQLLDKSLVYLKMHLDWPQTKEFPFPINLLAVARKAARSLAIGGRREGERAALGTGRLKP